MIANENRSELLQSLKEGSFSAFEKLYNLYSGKLYNFIMRLSSGNQYMAEEVVQQTFIRLWEVREKVDPTENFVSYLCTIARNLSMNMYQHQTVEYIYTEYLLKSNPDRDHQTEESTDLRLDVYKRQVIICRPLTKGPTQKPGRYGDLPYRLPADIGWTIPTRLGVGHRMSAKRRESEVST